MAVTDGSPAELVIYDNEELKKRMHQLLFQNLSAECIHELWNLSALPKIQNSGSQKLRHS